MSGVLETRRCVNRARTVIKRWPSTPRLDEPEGMERLGRSVGPIVAERRGLPCLVSMSFAVLNGCGGDIMGGAHACGRTGLSHRQGHASLYPKRGPAEGVPRTAVSPVHHVDEHHLQWWEHSSE